MKRYIIFFCIVSLTAVAQAPTEKREGRPAAVNFSLAASPLILLASSSPSLARSAFVGIGANPIAPNPAYAMSQTLTTISSVSGGAGGPLDGFDGGLAAEQVDGSMLLDTIERCYFLFRRRLRDVQQASTCDCNACILVPRLDLKVVAEHGRLRPRSGSEMLFP